MQNRKALQDRENFINESLKMKIYEVNTMDIDDIQKAKLKSTLMAKAAEARQKAIMEMGDDLQKMNLGQGIKVKGATVSDPNITTVDQSKLPDMSKQKGLGKEGLLKNLTSKIGKKAMGVVPVIGGIASAMQSGDASAAVPGLDSAESISTEQDLEYSPEQMANMKAYGELQQTGELTPDRLQRITNMLRNR